jgi:branched-chain amino acid transport system ATP-binding protein
MDNSQILITKGITKYFGDFIALNGVDFEIKENEAVGIIGPNGAGKTTFLNIITGYYMPDKGTVYAEGVDITGLSPAKRAALKIARTFQLVHVFDSLSVYDNVALAYFREKKGKALPLSIFSSSLHQPSVDQKVREHLDVFELAHLIDETVGNLPLGSKKRLELAMAFAAEPKVLLLDEPFAGLGDQEVDEIVDVLKRHTHNKTILVVEHKVSKLTDFVDRLAVLNAGEIISYGDCEQTLNDPEVRRCYWKV